VKRHRSTSVLIADLCVPTLSRPPVFGVVHVIVGHYIGAGPRCDYMGQEDAKCAVLTARFDRFGRFQRFQIQMSCAIGHGSAEKAQA